MEIEQTQLKDIKVGDKLIGSDGKPVEVVQVFDKYIPSSMYLLEMDDGQEVKCSGNHLWYCETDDDRANKKDYIKLAKHYFRHNKIPEFDDVYPSYPYNQIGEKFSNDKKSQELIERVCLSLGPSLATPNVLFDGTQYLTENKVYTYSYNDIIVFLQKLKRAIHKKDEYFYFGQVRETSTIAKLAKTQEINIPEHSDINHSNLK